MVTAGYFLGTIAVNYYNLKHNKFEPLIDPWNFEVNYLKIKE